MLGERNIFDLELVFRGEARGAFAWLQCFIAEEEEWCITRGCPGTSPRHTIASRLASLKSFSMCGGPCPRG